MIIKHDGDGKLFYEEAGRVVWLLEVPIHTGDAAATALNLLVVEKLTAYNKQSAPLKYPCSVCGSSGDCQFVGSDPCPRRHTFVRRCTQWSS